MSSREEEEETLSIEIPKNAIEQEIDLQDLVEMFVDRQLQKRQEMQVSTHDLQVAVIEIRDALQGIKQSNYELAKAIQLLASRGAGGVGGF